MEAGPMAERKAAVVKRAKTEDEEGCDAQCRVSPVVASLASKVSSLKSMSRGKLLSTILQPILEEMLLVEAEKISPRPKKGTK